MTRLVLLLVSLFLASCQSCPSSHHDEKDVVDGVQISRRLLNKEIEAWRAKDTNPAAMYALSTPSAILDDFTVLRRCVEWWVPACDPLQGIFLRRLDQLSRDYTLANRGERGRPLTGTADDQANQRDDLAWIQAVAQSHAMRLAGSSDASSDADDEKSSTSSGTASASGDTDGAKVDKPTTDPDPAPEAPPASSEPPAPDPKPEVEGSLPKVNPKK